jgi:hypothetical protein
MIDTRTSELGIGWLTFLKAPESSSRVKFRRITILVLEFRERLLTTIGTLKIGNNAPTGNRSRRIDRIRNRGIRRHHQIPAHKRERSGVAEPPGSVGYHLKTHIMMPKTIRIAVTTRMSISQSISPRNNRYRTTEASTAAWGP